MKKIFTMICAMVPALGFAQDTLVYENFDVDPTAAYSLVSNGNDTIWVDYDVDGHLDGSGASRPGNWFWSDAGFATVDVTGCIISNSWFAPAGIAANYLITPPIQIVDATAVVSWKSAPFQTPSFLDGYKVLVSTSNNFEPSFTDTIFVAGEYLTGSGNDFGAYTFSNGFVHGQDGTYIEDSGDSSQFLGELRPWTASLAAYSGQTIYIAFLHDSNDDNLISIDDILVTGTLSNGIKDIELDAKVSVSPNPATDLLKLTYRLPSTTKIGVNIFDQKGSLVKSFDRGMQIAGNQQMDLNISDLANGKYILQIIAGTRFTKTSFIVAK